MFTITVHCLTHDTEVENCSWFQTESGEFTFEFDNCPKGQIERKVGGCEVEVNLFDNEHYNGDEHVDVRKIATFRSRDYA